MTLKQVIKGLAGCTEYQLKFDGKAVKFAYPDHDKKIIRFTTEQEAEKAPYIITVTEVKKPDGHIDLVDNDGNLILF
jgi:hypothetical protein